MNTVLTGVYNALKPIDRLVDVAEMEAWLDDYCQAKQKSCWHHYGPADLEAYYADPLRIIIISAESWGYDGCFSVARGEYMKWLAKKDPSPRSAAVLVCAIDRKIQRLECGEPEKAFVKSEYQKLYQQDEVIMKRMERTGYLNARISSNATGLTKADEPGISKDIIEFSAYRNQLIQMLDPKIVICAGNHAFRSVFGEGRLWKSPEEWKVVNRIDRRLVVRTPHPRLLKNYRKVDEIAKAVAMAFTTANT